MRDDDAIEFADIQRAAEELLHAIAAGEVTPDEHVISRLEKLASAGAKLAYGRGCIELSSNEMHNLVAWCDHLDDSQWRESFVRSLRVSPLQSPFKG